MIVEQYWGSRTLFDLQGDTAALLSTTAGLIDTTSCATPTLGVVILEDLVDGSFQFVYCSRSAEMMTTGESRRPCRYALTFTEA
jgi:hypothetical protein